LRALIIGGGIGGLAAAIALRRIGWDAAVFEQAPELRESGAGLTVWSNASRALRILGRLDALESVSARLDRGEVVTCTDSPLAAISLSDIARRLDGPIAGVHRADLLRVLGDGIDRKTIWLSARFQRCEQDASGVTAIFADGRTERGDVLVGADGIQSQVRAQLIGDPLRYAGYVGWLGAATFGHPRLRPGVSVWTFGRGGQFGFVPIGASRYFWFATSAVVLAELEALGSHRDELLSRFGDWHEPIPEFIAALDETKIIRTPIYDRPPVRRWGTGRVTLLGDAAHATTPTLGHGACLAIESAVVLAQHLRTSATLDRALRAYEHERQQRTGWIIRRSREIGDAIHWRNKLLCALRDRLVRSTPATIHRWIVTRAVDAGRIE
jgi:2-polyprenyl-6-methoxyphenol hydroxylase-like FAD-dependent oxidoreductase